MNELVLDLFAGPGGWDYAAAQLGIDPIGFEWDGAACATRAAAGLRTIRADLDTYPPPTHLAGRIAGLIASPPCTDFSSAGNRAGRAGKSGHLVDIPMRWAEALHPTWIAWEQVPEVLPIWQDHARALRLMGYSAWTGVLCAADYGVPQTRRRAILMAHRDRPVQPPDATHDRDPHPNLFGPTLRPWVSMAEALGLDTITAGSKGSGPRLAFQQVDSALVLNPGVTPSQPNRRKYAATEPAPTLAFGHDAASWVWERPATTVCGDPRIAPPGHRDRAGGESQFTEGTIRITVEQAAALQGFPADWPWQGNKTQRFQQVGNAVPPPMAKAILEAVR